MLHYWQIGSAIATLVFVSAIPSQTVGPVEKDGRYWTQSRSGTVAAGARLRVSAIGSLSVKGAEVNQVNYRVVLKTRATDEREATLHFEQSALTVVERGGTVTLSLQDPACGRCGFSSEVELEVPFELEEGILNTRAGSISVKTIDGRVNADTAAGAIEMDVVGGDVRATTAGGSISLGRVGGDVRCETAGGSIKLDQAHGDAVLNTSGGQITVGEIGGTLHAETAGGGIEAEKVGGEVIAGTSGGSIRIGDAGGEVSAETAGGHIEVSRAPQGVEAETAGGHIRLTDVAGRVYAASAVGNIQAYFISSQPMRDSFLETTAGSIIVWLPADIHVVVDAMVDFARGVNRIESDFDAIRVSQERDSFGPGEVHASGALNGGGPVLTIRNTSGRIQIRRR